MNTNMSMSRNYLITANLNTSEIKAPNRMSCNILDENIMNIIIKLQIENEDGVSTTILKEQASNFNCELLIIKPNKTTRTVKSSVITSSSNTDAMFLFQLDSNCTNQKGKYSCELKVTHTVNTKEELLVCDPFVYEVKPSKSVELNEEIESNPDKSVLDELIENVKKVNNINDNSITKTTTYSSEKIEALMSELRSQLLVVTFNEEDGNLNISGVI